MMTEPISVHARRDSHRPALRSEVAFVQGYTPRTAANTFSAQAPLSLDQSTTDSPSALANATLATNLLMLAESSNEQNPNKRRRTEELEATHEVTQKIDERLTMDDVEHEGSLSALDAD